MIGSVSASRRANAFAQALEKRRSEGTTDDRRKDGVPCGHHRMADDTSEASLLALASTMEALARPELDLEVKTVHRAQLIAAMESAFAESGADGGPQLPEQRAAGPSRGSHRSDPLGSLLKFRPRSRLTQGLAAGGLTVGVAAGALTGVAAASTDALPGDSLYGLKRGMEDLKLGLASGDVERGKVYLHQASTRLKEVHRLMERQRSGELDEQSLEEIRRALSGMRHDASEGHRLLTHAFRQDGSLAPMESLTAFAENHRRAWSRLRGKLPSQLTEVGDGVNSVFEAIDHQNHLPRTQLPPALGTETSNAPASPSQPSASRGGLDAPPRSNAPSQGTSPVEESRPAAPHESTPHHGLLGEGPGGLLNPPGSSGGTSGPEDDSVPDVVPPLLPHLLNTLDLRQQNDQ